MLRCFSDSFAQMVSNQISCTKIRFENRGAFKKDVADRIQMVALATLAAPVLFYGIGLPVTASVIFTSMIFALGIFDAIGTPYSKYKILPQRGTKPVVTEPVVTETKAKPAIFSEDRTKQPVKVKPSTEHQKFISECLLCIKPQYRYQFTVAVKQFCDASNKNLSEKEIEDAYDYYIAKVVPVEWVVQKKYDYYFAPTPDAYSSSESEAYSSSESDEY